LNIRYLMERARSKRGDKINKIGRRSPHPKRSWRGVGDGAGANADPKSNPKLQILVTTTTLIVGWMIPWKMLIRASSTRDEAGCKDFLMIAGQAEFNLSWRYSMRKPISTH